jgi:hypothetical protein
VFVSDDLKTHLESSSTVSLQSLVIAEWNMNMPDNIFKLGNYRYRSQGADAKFKTIPSTFDQFDSANYYTGATDADIVVDGGFTNENVPQAFKSKKEKINMIYSLEDCLKPFRPRSGINKAQYFQGRHLANSGAEIAKRPRYYMPSRYDQFKYWTSYRTEESIEYGVANTKVGPLFYINDANPFVVYKEKVPANRLVVKMQTNVGDINLGPFATNAASITDPFFGDANKTTPSRFKIQYLDNNNWVDALSFNENSRRSDGTAIIKSDGHVEIQYGLIVPDAYRESFIFADRLSSAALLPEDNIDGYAYLVAANQTDRGTFYIWNKQDLEYKIFRPEYGWQLIENTVDSRTNLISDLTSPDYFNNESDNKITYRDFLYLRGIRIVVETMNKFDSTFDLIEMSPRLAVDISDKVIDYTINKSLSDIGNTSLPVGQLLASTGKVSLFDDDQAFNENNTNSIISKYINRNIKFKFFEKIINVVGYDYFVPIKTLYSEGFPQSDRIAATIEITLRDLFFFLESMPAPRLLTTQTSLSYAITLLLDYIGFSNYTFKRVTEESDPIIPFFFIAPDQNVAEVLNQLAVATQSAMFFDEYNNFVVMSKNYMMPTIQQRKTDIVLNGLDNVTDTGVIENNPDSIILPNIFEISSEDKKIFNDGKINYTARYIQRSYGSIRQSTMVDQGKTWIYKPSLLWEVAGTENTKTINEVASKQGSYVLGAMPINSDIPNIAPTVVNNNLINNVIDLGENVYWLTRYSGYFYSNGEIIRYDAAQFNVTLPIWYPIKSDGSLDDTKPQVVLPGKLAPANITSDTEIRDWRNSNRQGSSNVWISSNQEYQKYFSSLPFNGKIYPTGLVRIFSTPYYETVSGITRLKNGSVESHGRGQFGTQITSHSAGINQYWSDNAYVRGCNMNSQYLFNLSPTEDIQAEAKSLGLVIGPSGTNNSLARQTTRNGVIKNFMATNYLTETFVNSLKSTQTGTIQSSALIVNGPSFKTTEIPTNFVSYVYKELDNAYKHFGTRIRVVGKIENNISRSQTPIGSSSYYQVTGSLANQSINIGGGSGGLAVLLNPETNNGYYFEIIALTENNIESYSSGNLVNNVIFYKVMKKEGSTSEAEAIPVKLWGGLTNVLVDDGRFTGQYRISGEENPTVYDLSVEYQDIGKTRKFYLYINNKLVQVVDDTDPLPIYNNMALFSRGSSRCMFENVYALAANYSQNTVSSAVDKLSEAFGDDGINLNESFRKYAVSGAVQATYLSGVSAQQSPKYNMYFEEFGTIMRECAYFDIRYDRAYPALYAQLSPTFNRIKGYTTSGFQADSYGAEFLIFNATDKALLLDETTGNFLRIQGITFTQDTTHELSVDEYFKKRSNFSDPELKGSEVLVSPVVERAKYDEIKQSRMIYGKNEFSIDSPYIQTQDDAEALMGWLINKLMKPKKSIGLDIFSIPTIQLGDIVTINYKDSNGLNLVSSDTSRFVVYNTEYSRTPDGPNMKIYVSEV